MDTLDTAGSVTRAEIFQQPSLWATTLTRVPAFDLPEFGHSVVITGAGTSAYAATAVAAAWPNAHAIASTDLLTSSESYFELPATLLSLARSGDSPESVGVVKRIQTLFSAVRHLAITCNSQGRLANHPGVNILQLDPRTNDQSLVMTSSFSNLVLCFLSSSPWVRSYELDLLDELHAKKLGYVVAITPSQLNEGTVYQQVRAIAPKLPDNLRTPFEIVFAQFARPAVEFTNGTES